MRRLRWAALLAGFLLPLLGCDSLSRQLAADGSLSRQSAKPRDSALATKDDEGPDKKGKEKSEDRKKDEPNGKGNGKDDRPPKALLEWGVGKKDRSNSDSEPDDRIVTDRPDFTEASVTVGQGRIQLESGYTWLRDGQTSTRLISHSYPEMLWRIGLFADWFELRIGQNFFSQTQTTDGSRIRSGGADDLYLGVKIALTEQQGWLPETAVILQATVPSGARAFTSKEVDPGINWLYGWDIIPNFLSLGGSTQINRSRGGLDSDFPLIELPSAASNNNSFVTLAQSLTVGYELSRRLGAFTEWFAFFPHGAFEPNIGPEYYLDGGFTYLLTNNFQVDIRAGIGLNRHADDFYAGSGFAVRY